ncbi:hypothetical protein [Streptomyces sp. cf386]|uniref:hypothetical protein n=1 Tax=Streptomyces sp. cf386 TaxID=1761904 RepID=UPI0015A43EB4|nr:hypothetical protein [Streptomyces sp. cf386]
MNVLGTPHAFGQPPHKCGIALWVKVGDVPGFAQEAVSSLEGKNWRKRGSAWERSTRVFSTISELYWSAVVSSVGVEDDLVAPGAGPAGDARHAGVLGGQALGGGDVLAARPDAGGGVEDDGLVAEHVPGVSITATPGPRIREPSTGRKASGRTSW